MHVQLQIAATVRSYCSYMYVDIYNMHVHSNITLYSIASCEECKVHQSVVL